MNNHVHVWGIARELWHHGHFLANAGARPRRGLRLPLRFANWTTAAIVWPAARRLGSHAVDRARRGRLHRRHVPRVPGAPPGLVGRRRAREPGDHRVAPVRTAVLCLGRRAPVVRGRRVAARTPLARGVARRPRPGNARARSCCRSPRSWLCVCLPFVPDRRSLLRWYALSLLITLPAVVLVFASPGYADATTRDRLVNFIGTLGPRVLFVAMPVIFVLARRTGIRVFAPWPWSSRWA